MSSAVPEGWTDEALSHFCKGIRGVSYKPDDLSLLASENTVTLLRSNNIQDSGLVLTNVQYVAKNRVKPLQLAMPQDIAVCMSNGSKRLVGKSSTFQDVPNIGKYTVGAFCSIFRPTEFAHPDFTRQLFQSNQYSQQVELSLAGSAINNLKNSDLEEYRFPCPPLPEQKKIASILTSVDEVIEKTESQIAKLQDLKTGMMQELFTKGIGHTEFKDSSVGRIPVGWIVADANSVCSKITKGTTPPKSEYVDDSKIPFLRVNNLSFDNKVHFENGILFLSRAVQDGFLARSKVYPEDILMNIVGPPLGKVAITPNDYSEYNVNQAVIIFRALEGRVNNRFLLHYLTSNLAQNWLQTRSKKTSGQQNLTIELCKALPIPLPPIEEQTSIAQALDGVGSLLSAKNSKLATIVRIKKALMQDLLTGNVRVKTD